ncbi:MAG: hypothetical protein Q7W55_15555 [Pseudohongiella sp.]|nr:hypothetical protein [Pseudohongiella sp.]MDO9519279.1 hypothetical protein [Pseudohongiella sp.]MDP2126110.1 hypothetical protein [Pseudohongiella sp.]
MSIRTAEELKHAQNLATTAQTLAIIAMVTLIVAIVARGGTVIAGNLFSSETTWRDGIQNIGLVLIELLPAFLFIEAINHLRRALTKFGSGEFFRSDVSQHVAEAGSFAIYAMLALMVITPNLTLWVSHQGGFDVRIEPEYIGMLAFAVFVCAVGKILSAATDIKSENDAFV